MLCRRAILQAAAALPFATPEWAGAAAGLLAPIKGACESLAGPGLLRSYFVEHGANATAFDRVQENAAFTYDNALAGLALLAAGERTLAMRIGEALRIAQSADRRGFSGRVRNAYQPGPMTTPPKLAGWWDERAGKWFEDPYQTGTSSGVQAWAMLLWAALDRAGTGRFRAAQERAAGWLESMRVTRGYRGGILGDAAGDLNFVSTEENLDAGAALRALGRDAAAAHALAFVRAMWDPTQQRFDAGLAPDGSRNTLAAADANLWPQIAAGMPARLRPALLFVLSKLGQSTADGLHGIGFSAGIPGIWLEGTAFAALALRLAGAADDRATAARFLATLQHETAPNGFIYAASTRVLETGLAIAGPGSALFRYYRRPALAPTAWAVLAAFETSPFGPRLPAALL